MKIKRLFRLALFPALFLLAAGPVFAEIITFTADKMAGYSGDTSDYTKLEGNAVIKTTKIEISADLVELSGDDFRFITATGRVKGRNIESDMDFSCDSMYYDRKTEIVTLRTNAEILDHQNEVSAKSQLIEYNQKTEIAIMQIDVELKQKRSLCTAAFAIYRKQEQMLEMNGNPQIKRDDDLFRAREITLNMDTEDILLDGRVRGSVTSKDTAEAEGSAPAASPEETVSPVSTPESPPEAAQ
ncbi:MAG: organic solvent tolerance protein OstA [Treponema sp.]|jgi:lipopolysaccharide export system protein LptA|nr:organic solvent tolerance protein OstA [Treponema sp.]